MANKKFWLGMLVLVLAFGMTVIGCDDDTDKGRSEGGGGNSITITGITGKTGDALIYVASGLDSENGMVAEGMGTISGGSVTFNLVKDQAMNPWTGSGSYYLMLEFDQDESEYYYTNGQTINISAGDENPYAKLPKYNITSAASTIAFNLFKEITLSEATLPAPTGLTATPFSNNSIQISWNAVSGAASYKVYQSTSAAGIYIVTGTTTGTSYNDSIGIMEGQDYYYKVSALTSENIEGELSDYALGRIQTKAITQFRFADFAVNGTINGTNISVTVPNIVNLTTLAPTITHNGKSVSPASGAAQDFTSPVQYTVTGEDNTTKNYTVTVTVTSTTLASAFSWINSDDQSKENTTFTIVVQANESLAPTTIAARYGSTNIILKGGTTEKTISLSGNDSLFTVGEGILTLENNITLSGSASNTASLVKINNNGTLVMKTGSKIQNNTVATANNTDALGGGVYINGGTFTMDGGTVSGNKVQAGTSGSYSNTSVRVKGGGVYLYNGTFVMNSGTISNNTAYSAYYPSAGGGVYIENSKTFTMNGGTISDNTAESSSILATSYTYGGGVAAWDNSTFTMKGGTISGNVVKTASNCYGGGVYVHSDKFTKTGGTIYGSNVLSATLQNTAKNDNSGHAVYASVSSTTLKRNTTAGTTVSMDSSRTGSTGGWE